MTIGMNDDSVVSIAQLREFQKLSHCATFIRKSDAEAYEWIGRTLSKFEYARLRKRDRSVVKRYLITMTGYSETQIDRLIRRKKDWGRVLKKKRTQPTFARIYTSEDVALLVEVDNAEGRRTGGAVKKTLEDMYHVYNDERFVRLSNISVAHIYNLRGTRQYTTKSLTYTRTQATSTSIGIRKRPQPFGKPGYVRVDSVHQGDLDKKKGVYHLNLVDEVTQGEVVVTVEGISEQFLLPALEEALEQFAFVVIGFHSDNGSEYINKKVARLLSKLLIEQTKSRARRTNDNALVEGKNAAVVRRHFGYAHIPKKFAPLMNEFNHMYLNPYLNYHRMCAFAREEIDARGKIKKIYDTHLSPVGKLLSIEHAERYLKPGVTVELLTATMHAKSHLAAAQEMQNAKSELFKKINKGML